MAYVKVNVLTLSPDSSYVGPAVFLSGTLKFLGAGPTGPPKKITKIRAANACVLWIIKYLTD